MASEKATKRVLLAAALFVSCESLKRPCPTNPETPMPDHVIQRCGCPVGTAATLLERNLGMSSIYVCRARDGGDDGE